MKTITPKRPLSYFFGILNKEEADLLEKTIEESRKIHRELHEKREKRIQEEFKNSGIPLICDEWLKWNPLCSKTSGHEWNTSVKNHSHSLALISCHRSLTGGF